MPSKECRTDGPLRDAGLLPEAGELIDGNQKPLDRLAPRRVRQVPGIFEAAHVFASAAADEIGEPLEERNAFRIACWRT